jgi:hypothetical protein
MDMVYGSAYNLSKQNIQCLAVYEITYHKLSHEYVCVNLCSDY